MKRHSRNIIVGFLGLTIIFASCDIDNRDRSTTEFGNIQAELIDSLRSIGQELQQLPIDPSKDNVLKGRNGTVVYIPANSLVTENGTPISSQTVIELKEHYVIADYITSNLQTVHDNDLLQTQGMIFLSAKNAQGTTVKIDRSKPVRIEFPLRERVAGAKIFTGKRDERGNLNWSDINEPVKSLVPYSIRSIGRNRFSTECPDFYGITQDTLKNKYFNYYGDLSQFENTFLATREFKERYEVACWEEVLNIYVNNRDKNLWEADELAVKYFIQDSTKRVNNEINWRPPGINGGARTKEQDDAHERLVNGVKESSHEMIKAFKIFAGQKLTTVDPTKRISDTAVSEMNTVFIAYDALEFGWVNVDYFYKDPRSANIRLAAKTNQTAYIINLIIPGRNIILSGIPKDDNTYYFTKNEDGYNKLPKGERAFIVAITIADNKLVFGEHELILGQKETETIELTPTTAETIKTRLNNLGR
jgi:hypothetical protein